MIDFFTQVYDSCRNNVKERMLSLVTDDCVFLFRNSPREMHGTFTMVIHATKLRNNSSLVYT